MKISTQQELDNAIASGKREFEIISAGKPGFDLERKYGSEQAGKMIYAVSRLDRDLPDFHCDDEDALSDIRESALVDRA